jgi:hypothetical protein
MATDNNNQTALDLYGNQLDGDDDDDDDDDEEEVA